MTTLQGSLIDGGDEITTGPVADGLVRTELGSGAWFELRRGWIRGSDALFSRLEHAVPWRAEERWMYDRIVAVPRLVAHYDEGEPLPDASLHAAMGALREHYRDEAGSRFATVGLCFYRGGRDSVAWHGDRIGRGASEDVLVAIVSLGAERRFQLRPRGGGPSRSLELGRGDLFVMGGSCQRTWDHTVPKSTSVSGARISVQFRPHGTR